jgi:Nif11 domain
MILFHGGPACYGYCTTDGHEGGLMSVQDAERFAKDLKAKPQMLADLKKTAAGKGLSGVCQFAKQKGYNVTIDEAKSYIRSRAKTELNDQQLDRLAGGKGVNVTTVANYGQVTNVGVTNVVAAAVIVIT